MDNDFYRPQGTDSQSSDTNQTTMGQEVNQEAAGGQNTESQAQDSTYHYGRNFNSETTYHTNAAPVPGCHACSSACCVQELS